MKETVELLIERIFYGITYTIGKLYINFLGFSNQDLQPSKYYAKLWYIINNY